MIAVFFVISQKILYSVSVRSTTVQTLKKIYGEPGVVYRGIDFLGKCCMMNEGETLNSTEKLQNEKVDN